MSERTSDTCSLEELCRVEMLQNALRNFSQNDIGAEFCQFREKLKETTDRVMELEKAMSHFENEQLEMKESTIPMIIEEGENRTKSIRDKILALNLWGRK